MIRPVNYFFVIMFIIGIIEMVISIVLLRNDISHIGLLIGVAIGYISIMMSSGRIIRKDDY